MMQVEKSVSETFDAVSSLPDELNEPKLEVNIYLDGVRCLKIYLDGIRRLKFLSYYIMRHDHVLFCVNV